MQKKLGVGFVGAGWMGQTLLGRLSERPDVKICSLHQRSKDRAIAVLKKLKLNSACFVSEYGQLLANPEVDAVFICSTNEVHGLQAIAAQEAGKHVFCEKPCATRFDEFCHQIKLEQENPDRITYVNYLMNFDTLENEIKAMAAQGDFGIITQIQVNYRHPINIVGDKVWKLSARRMGDAIGMGIIHSLSVMLNIMAAQDAKPVRVYASNSDVHTRPFELPAVWNLHISFTNGGTGLCLGNLDQANGYDAYHNVHGTAGGLIFDSYLDRPQKIRFWSEEKTRGKWVYPLDPNWCEKNGMKDQIWPDSTTTPDSGDVVQHQTGACLDHFLRCIQQREQSFLSFVNSAEVAELGWAAQISAACQTPVALPLDWEEARRFFANNQI